MFKVTLKYNSILVQGNLKSTMESEVRADSLEPLSVLKASRQYVFTENGEEYLDCLNGSAHIGHTHPQVTNDMKIIFNILYSSFILVAKTLIQTLRI